MFQICNITEERDLTVEVSSLCAFHSMLVKSDDLLPLFSRPDKNTSPSSWTLSSSRKELHTSPKGA